MSFLLVALFLVFAAVATAVPVAPTQTQVQAAQLQAAQAPVQPMAKADFIASLDARPVCNILCAVGFKCCIVRGQATCVPVSQVCHP